MHWTSERRPDRFELGVLGLLIAVSLWVLGFDVWEVAAHGRAWTGADGYYPVDQLQYLAWVRDASRHLLASDLYVLRPTAHDYLEPVVAIAGGLTALSVAPWLALLAFGPVSVVALFVALRTYCRRLLRARWEWRAALVAALFFGSFGVLGDEWIPFLTWGYVPAVLAIAAMVGALLAYDRSLAGGRIWPAPVLGLFAAWLHPWQGEELLFIVAGIELARLARPGWFASWRLRGDRGKLILLPALTVTATGLPLVYYAVLQWADPTWRLAQAAGLAPWSLGAALLPLVPLLALASLGYLQAPKTFLAAATQAWPWSAVLGYGLFDAGFGAAPLHLFNGITIPLAVLAVGGASRAGLGRIRGHSAVAAIAVAAATIPATVHMIRSVPGAVGPAANHDNFVTRGEQRALTYLARDPAPGGVLTTSTLGTVVPADTGRRTFVGDCYWSIPNCPRRGAQARWLFQGPVRAGAARAFVDATTARFVLIPCDAGRSLQHALGPIVSSVHRFGCASVFAIRTHRL